MKLKAIEQVLCTKCWNFNVLIDEKGFFDIPIKNDEETDEHIIEKARNNDYTTRNLVDYEYFSKHY